MKSPESDLSRIFIEKLRETDELPEPEWIKHLFSTSVKYQEETYTLLNFIRWKKLACEITMNIIPCYISISYNMRSTSLHENCEGIAYYGYKYFCQFWLL
jgi:hypothetical protein